MGSKEVMGAGECSEKGQAPRGMVWGRSGENLNKGERAARGLHEWVSRHKKRVSKDIWRVIGVPILRARLMLSSLVIIHLSLKANEICGGFVIEEEIRSYS